jgi:hypothetical protein
MSGYVLTRHTWTEGEDVMVGWLLEIDGLSIPFDTWSQAMDWLDDYVK